MFAKDFEVEYAVGMPSSSERFSTYRQAKALQGMMTNLQEVEKQEGSVATGSLQPSARLATSLSNSL